MTHLYFTTKDALAADTRINQFCALVAAETD
jgi:hypothetical protein